MLTTQCNDYDLVCLTEDCYYYVVSPKDVVVAKVRGCFFPCAAAQSSLPPCQLSLLLGSACSCLLA